MWQISVILLSLTDKIKKSKRDGGTPDKPGTPSASRDALLEEELGGRRVIINDEILAMHIKEENLVKVCDTLILQL